MTKWLLLLAALSANVNAIENALVGNYVRQFSDSPDKADIVVSQQGQNLAVVAFGAYLPANMLSEKEMTVLWQRLEWSHSTLKTSRCLKFDMQDICAVSAGTKMLDGTPVDAGYYYYDPLVGLATLLKLAH